MSNDLINLAEMRVWSKVYLFRRSSFTKFFNRGKTMMILGLVVLFYVPAAYIAKSKGYKAFPLIGVLTVISSLVVLIIVALTEILYPIAFSLSPVLTFVIIWLLPPKEDAPGKGYLKIKFECPECNGVVVFHRSQEGKAELCPWCGEIITIPLDEFSSKPSVPERIKPGISSGQVCYASYGDEMLAVQLQALLEDNGIQSEIICGTGGGALPQLSGTQGFKISIDIDDWDKAVEVEKSASDPSEDAS